MGRYKRGGGPGALTNKVLHRADIQAQGQGHRFNGFAGAVAQQALEVVGRPVGLVGPEKQRRKQGMIGGKIGNQPFNVPWGEITFRRGAGFCYNQHGHGPFLRRLAAFKTRIPCPPC